MGNPGSGKNYMLGAGIAKFALYDPATGNYGGYRDMGNAPSITFNTSIEKLAHYSSRGGLRAKDAEVVTEVSPKLTMTLDEIVATNLALIFMGSAVDVDQVADDDNSIALETVEKGKEYDLGKREVGVIKLDYDGGTAIFNEGSTLTGATSTATANIVQIIGDATSGTLYLNDVTGGPFQDDEVLSDDGGTPGAAVANGIDTFLATALSVEDTDTPSTKYVAGTDFTVGSKPGFIKCISDTIDTKNITVDFANAVSAYKKIEVMDTTSVIGRFWYVSDNPEGPEMELKLWRVSMTPSGDTNFIGTDWGVITVEAEILKDETDHPANPYGTVILEETA